MSVIVTLLVAQNMANYCKKCMATSLCSMAILCSANCMQYLLLNVNCFYVKVICT
jgi:hypothetical protein